MSIGGISASAIGFSGSAASATGSAAASSQRNAPGPLAAQTTKATTASLEGQIQVARQQLNDWVTCVSATTPTGKAEIGSLSAQISAAQEHINHLQQTGSNSTAATGSATGSSGSRLDVWA